MPKRTYQPKKRKRRKTHGWTARSDSVIKNRRKKGRHKLTVSDEARNRNDRNKRED